METIIDLDLPYPVCADHASDPMTLAHTPEGREYLDRAEAHCFIPAEKRRTDAVRRITVTIHHPPERRMRDESNIHLAIFEVLDHLGLLQYDMRAEDLLVLHGTPIAGGLLAVEIKEGQR